MIPFLILLLLLAIMIGVAAKWIVTKDPMNDPYWGRGWAGRSFPGPQTRSAPWRSRGRWRQSPSSEASENRSACATC